MSEMYKLPEVSYSFWATSTYISSRWPIEFGYNADGNAAPNALYFVYSRLPRVHSHNMKMSCHCIQIGKD